MKIEFLQKADEKKWDKFVLGSKEATFSHLLGWRNAIQKSYGLKPFYLVAKEGEEIKGMLPAFLAEHFFFGKKIVSLPFLNYGGVASPNTMISRELVDYLKKYAQNNQTDLLELRSLSASNDLPADTSQVTFLLKLQSEQALLEKFDKKVRNQIKKAGQFNLELKRGQQCLKEFYRLYQKTMRRLGTPVHSFAFFQNIIEEFPEQSKVFIAAYKNKPIAGSFIFALKDTAFNLWAASDIKYANMNPNDYLYWEAIKYYTKAGFKYFDFGRSEKDSGTFNFKKQWGTKIKQLYYFRHPEAVSDKRKYGSLAAIWKLLPLSIANLVGPKIRKYIP